MYKEIDGVRYYDSFAVVEEQPGISNEVLNLFAVLIYGFVVWYFMCGGFEFFQKVWPN